MKHLPHALASALLLIGGSARAVASGGIDTLSVALLAAGLIVLGVWIKEE